MKVRLAHLQQQGINFVVFDADATDHTDSSRATLLSQLVMKARISGLKVEKAALAFSQHGRLGFYGSKDLVKLLVSASFAGPWTHEIDL